MANIFETADSIFFVGGQGAKIGLINAGGCTRTWWETELGANPTKTDKQNALNKLMGANGEAKFALTGLTYTGSAKQFTVTDSMGIEAGMVAHITGGGILSGRYEITGVPDSTHITVSGLAYTGNNTDSAVTIGGAFDSLPSAVSSGVLDAMSYHVNIYTNKSETFTSSVIFGCEGTLSKGTRLSVRGYNEVVDDMDRGGEYYQNPYDAYLNGIDANAFVLYDNQTSGFTIDISGRDNILLSNLHIKGTLTGFYASDLCKGWALEHCVFSGAYSSRAIDTYKAYYASIFDCYFDGSTYTGSDQFIRMHRTSVNTVYSNVFVGQIDKDMLCLDGGFVFNNLFVNNKKSVLFGISDQITTCVALNNTSYNNSGAVFYNGWVSETANWSQVHFLNNLTLPVADRIVWSHSGTGGTAVNIANNCSYRADGFTNIYGSTALGVTKNNLEVDPDCVDIVNKDFRPRNPMVLHGGLDGLTGKSAQIGAILQEYQFASSGRMVKMARLGITR